jgi:hypothetical protein
MQFLVILLTWWLMKLEQEFQFVGESATVQNVCRKNNICMKGCMSLMQD